MLSTHRELGLFFSFLFLNYYVKDLYLAINGLFLLLTPVNSLRTRRFNTHYCVRVTRTSLFVLSSLLTLQLPSFYFSISLHSLTFFKPLQKNPRESLFSPRTRIYWISKKNVIHSFSFGSLASHCSTLFVFIFLTTFSYLYKYDW